eukprot:5420972-Prymnesium_polylepis.1
MHVPCFRLYVCGCCSRTLPEADAFVCNCCGGAVFCHSCQTAMPTSVSCRFNNELQNAVHEITLRESFPFVSMIYPQSTDKKTGKSVKAVPIT